MEFEVKIRAPGRKDTFSIQVSNENTVDELIDKYLQTNPDIKEKDSLMVVLKGKMLKKDQKIEELKANSDSVFNFIKKPKQREEDNVDDKSDHNKYKSKEPPRGRQLVIEDCENPFDDFGSGFIRARDPKTDTFVDPNTIIDMMMNPGFKRLIRLLATKPIVVKRYIRDHSPLRKMVKENPEILKFIDDKEFIQNAVTHFGIQTSMNRMRPQAPSSGVGYGSSKPSGQFESFTSGAPGGDLSALSNLFKFGGSSATAGGVDFNSLIQNLGGGEGLQNLINSINPQSLQSILGKAGGQGEESKTGGGGLDGIGGFGGTASLSGINGPRGIGDIAPTGPSSESSKSSASFGMSGSTTPMNSLAPLAQTASLTQTAPSSTPGVSKEEINLKFQEGMRLLNELGFTDVALNTDVLVQCGLDVNNAANILSSMQ